VLDFEVKHKEEVERPLGLSVGISVQNRDQPLMPDEIPVESGSVLRQKNEIEMKYGSSPRHSKLSPDHSLCPPSVSPSDTARLTPTLEKYCTSDILSFTEEVPEGFLDDDVKDFDSWQKWHQNDSLQPSSFLNQNLPESDLKQLTNAGSQFQGSFSYRENCQQKQSKMSPFFSRSASMRARGLADAAKSDNALVASIPGFICKTSVSSFASFSSTEVCRRLLKEKSQLNESAPTNKPCDPSSESMQVNHVHHGTQQSISHSSRTELPAEPSTYLSTTNSSVATHVQPSSTAESNNCRKLVAGNTASVDDDCSLVGDRVLESSLKAFSESIIQSQSIGQPTQVDASGINSEPAVHDVQSLPSEQVNETSTGTQLVASQPQLNDMQQHLPSQLNKRYSFRDKSASFILAEPEKLFRSQSVRDKSTSSCRRHVTGSSELAEAWKVKKPYGKSHPLSKLSGEYLSRNRSTTIKDSTCDRDTL